MSIFKFALYTLLFCALALVTLAQTKPQPIYRLDKCRTMQDTADGLPLLYEYDVCRLTFKGRFKEYVDKMYGVEKFGPYLVYLGCGARADEHCENWTLLEISTGKRQKINNKLPAFDFILSSPAFKWPLVAYMGFTKTRPDRGRFECVAFDWRNQEVIRRLTAFVAPLPATDSPGVSPQPVFSQNGQVVTCRCEECDGKPRIFKMSLLNTPMKQKNK